MIKVVHLIPFDGVGGVEVAAKSMQSVIQDDVKFEVQYIFKNIDLNDNYWSTFNPLIILSLAWQISRSDVDLLVVSLWRSSIVGLIVKLIRPKLKLVTFLHLDRNVHFLDFIFTYLSVWISTQVWADSQATLNRRIKRLQPIKGRVISFVTERHKPLPDKSVVPTFIFWGRIGRQKDLGRAIHLFAAILKYRLDAKFTIIGPDAGTLQAIKNLCKSLGLTESVIFLGASSRAEIINYAGQASFYLQTSVAEGMAMSVVEAMQFGLLPVVTPVGEIGAYCKTGVNAVIVSSEQESVKAVLELLNSNDRFQEMRSNAITTWLDKPLYRESILLACKDCYKPLER